MDPPSSDAFLSCLDPRGRVPGLAHESLRRIWAMGPPLRWGPGLQPQGCCSTPSPTNRFGAFGLGARHQGGGPNLRV